MKNNQFHIDFKLNGNSFFSVDELLLYSKTLSGATHKFLKDWFSKRDVIEVETSGSTGKPKMIQLKKEFMVNSALATGEFFDLQEKTTALLCMSVDYIAGKMMLVRALVLGWEIDVIEPKSNPLQNINKVYDFSAMVPMQLQNSLLEIDAIKKLIVGGGVVSEELQKEIQDVSTEVFATFGMTETITHIAIKRLNHLSPRAQSRGLGYYQLLPNVAISKDARNCLVIDASKVSEEQIVTNDVVELISETTFKWLGRYDNVINSGGIKLHPEEIEKKLSQIIKQRFFVAGIPDETLGEKLILIVEENSTSIDVESSLKNQLNLRLNKATGLTKYEIPKAIYFVAKFVETETKKIQREKTIKICNL
jgi:O-succinylbenzoic acid--CoA ligase